MTTSKTEALNTAQRWVEEAKDGEARTIEVGEIKFTVDRRTVQAVNNAAATDVIANVCGGCDPDRLFAAFVPKLEELAKTRVMPYED